MQSLKDLQFCSQLVAMRDVSATEAAVITTMEPLWGAAFAWCVLGERWGLRGWVGAAFILCGSLANQIWGSLETPVKRTKVPLPILEEQDAQNLALPTKPPVHNLGESIALPDNQSATNPLQVTLNTHTNSINLRT